MRGDLFGNAMVPRARPPAPRQSTGFIHPCEAPGCTAWGAFGFGLPASRARWFCSAHRAVGEASL